MRKHQHKNILELLGTIKEAQAAGFYADCQEGALSVGEFIEDIEGEGTQAVALLEEYCDLLFAASNGEIGERQLNKHLVKIENTIGTELKPNRIEVAFLSYKASMSDSLESIYFAAKEDPGYDAYWIPIPYYDRTADGSFGEMHYEGAECYSDKYECTDWQTYDVEARHPDVIFTFSPYDANNFVTSVHPAFYCERLRDLTDMLVYVPYFVSGDSVAKHFCTLTGCKYAHRVIVQSENIRKDYIRFFSETFGNSFGNPDEKFIALGSPKFDKVINAKCEDFDLPNDWAKLINGKKVVLLNSSVGTILHSNEQYLKKLRHIFDFFKNRDDLVLWWRPHPLNEATYASMRPQLMEEYTRIVADFRSEGWGIYDDTTDLHRALFLTDMYYGDSSSLWVMYLVAGKPVMIQNPEVMPEYRRPDKSVHDFSETVEQLQKEESHVFTEKIESLSKLITVESEPYELMTTVSVLMHATYWLGCANVLNDFRRVFISASGGTSGKSIFEYVNDFINQQKGVGL